MSEHALTAHKKGRQPFEPRHEPWPIVTQSLLARAASFEPLLEDGTENPLIGTLTRGYVHLCNCEVNLRRAMAEARKKGDAALAQRVSLELERVAQVKEEWPLVIVGREKG